MSKTKILKFDNFKNGKNIAVIPDKTYFVYHGDLYIKNGTMYGRSCDTVICYRLGYDEIESCHIDLGTIVYPTNILSIEWEEKE